MSNATPESDAKPEPPKGLIEKLGAALPIGLTAIATIFAGMSTGELQKAMYWKSQAAQDQARATNQWTLFGFKRSRALEMETAAARSRSDSGYLRFQFVPEKDGSSGQWADAARWLNGDGPPRTELPPPEDAKLAQLVADIKDRKPERDLLALAAKIPVAALNKAIDDGESFVTETTEKKWDEVVRTAKGLARTVTETSARNKADEPVDAAKKARADAVQALVFAMEDRRYRGEGALNNALGYLYEARVKFSSAESDKHRKKSEHLFYAMLVAQIGAVVSSLALARKTGSALWLIAGLAGALAIAFGAVVFLDKLPGE